MIHFRGVDKRQYDWYICDGDIFGDKIYVPLLYFESFMVAIITCLTAMESLCHRWPRIYSVYCRHNFVLISPFMTSECLTRVTRWGH